MTLNSPSNTQQLELGNITNSGHQSQQSQSQEEPGQTSTDIPTHLPCSCCGQMLPIDHFSKDSGKPHRYFKQSYCRDCSLKAAYEWQQQHPLRVLIASAKNHNRNKHDFDIDEEYLQLFDTDTCPILGIPIQCNIGKYTGQENKGGRQHSPDSKSLDRVDSTKGYIKGNVQIISWRANNLKGNATLEEMVLLGEWALQQLINEITY